jgi:hypothetical protein
VTVHLLLIVRYSTEIYQSSSSGIVGTSSRTLTMGRAAHHKIQQMGQGPGSVPVHPGPFAEASDSIHAQRPRGNGRPTSSLTAAMMASCTCSTLLSSSTPFRTRTSRPSLRTPSRHRSLPLPGLSVQPALVFVSCT